MNENAVIQALREFLEAQAPGPIIDSRALTRLLFPCWAELHGGDETGMTGDKLHRIEHPTWEPPVLKFRIERHGQTVKGSTRATVYEWRVDMQALTASKISEKYRQITPSDKRFDVKPIAESLAAALIAGAPNENLEIRQDGTVKLKIKQIIPETVKETTTTTRRKRLRKLLDALLEPHGWKALRPNIYTRG